MTRLGRGELLLGRVFSPDQIIERINKVTLDQVADLAGRLFLNQPKVLSLVGPARADLSLSQFGFAEVRHG
ncbi:MAG TPA: insulinase family protein, partial [Symbiobacteriaceae bacterium]|nr:insulinase family protein [Symbiobacteriaceae bacterium]